MEMIKNALLIIPEWHALYAGIRTTLRCQSQGPIIERQTLPE